MRFDNQGVFITGAGSGIGERAAHAFALAGAIVAVTDRDEANAKRVAEAIGPRAHAFALDVTDPKAVASVMETAARRLGRLDVLLNSAGVREIVPVLELSAEEFARVLTINVTGTFLPSQAFARHIVAAKTKGAIVNIASTLGVTATPQRAAYTASKHAVVGLTKSMALELGEQGIRVNAVGPGVIRTPLTERYFQDAAQSQRIRDIHALGRWGEADEVTGAILFLASAEASFCTGSMLMVDGGWTAGRKF